MLLWAEVGHRRLHLLPRRSDATSAAMPAPLGEMAADVGLSERDVERLAGIILED